MLSFKPITIPSSAVEILFLPYGGENDMRLKRLRVLTSKGNVSVAGIKSLCVTLGATFYDNLHDAFDADDVLECFHNLSELYETGEITGAYLYLCCIYGDMDEVIPEAIQWAATHEEVLIQFLETFIAQQIEYLWNDGLIGGDDDSGEVM